MASENVFEKRHGEEDLLNDVSGVLDHLNLPPAVVEFVRKNKKILQVVTVIVVVLTVFFSLYGSYKEKKLEDSAARLSLALLETGDAKIDALKKVADDYDSTPSALWAKVEIAHELMAAKKYNEAVVAYLDIHETVSEKNPANALSLYGMAQAYEMVGDKQQSMDAYKKLESVPGYKTISYGGVARMYELMGDKVKAREVYERYLTEINASAGSSPEKALIEAKLENLKAAE